MPMLDDFSRLNMEYTVMSKRKLTQFVQVGKVWGWDDPRMPTARGLLRRGVAVHALWEFVKVQGMSKVHSLFRATLPNPQVGFLRRLCLLGCNR